MFNLIHSQHSKHFLIRVIHTMIHGSQMFPSLPPTQQVQEIHRRHRLGQEGLEGLVDDAGATTDLQGIHEICPYPNITS